MLLTLAFVAIVVMAMIEDGRRFRIPNWMPLAILALFVLRIAVGRPFPVHHHIMVAAAVFAVTYASFVMGWFGGGDVKLLTAVCLWVSPQEVLVLLMIMAITGSVLGVALLILRRRVPSIGRPTLGPLTRWAARGACPYGIPIGIGTLAVTAMAAI